MLTHFIPDTLLGPVPQGKQFGSQIRPHILGPDLRAKLFAVRSIFLQIMTMTKIFAKYLIIPTADEIFKMAEHITQHTMG